MFREIEFKITKNIAKLQYNNLIARILIIIIYYFLEGVWKNKEELKALRKTQQLISPQKPQEYDDELLEDWGRAIERSLSWYAISD